MANLAAKFSPKMISQTFEENNTVLEGEDNLSFFIENHTIEGTSV